MSSDFTTMTSTKTIGPPLLGALLRMPLGVIRWRMIQALHEHGHTDLVPAHFVLLRYPGPNGERPGDLAEQAKMSKQAMNYLLNQLERLGYLERRADAGDQRAKRVYLTERGKATIDLIRATVRQVEEEWAQELGADKLEQLRELLTELAAVVADSDGLP